MLTLVLHLYREPFPSVNIEQQSCTTNRVVQLTLHRINHSETVKKLAQRSSQYTFLPLQNKLLTSISQGVYTI